MGSKPNALAASQRRRERRERLEEALPLWLTMERFVLAAYLLLMAGMVALCILGITGVLRNGPPPPPTSDDISLSDLDSSAHR